MIFMCSKIFFYFWLSIISKGKEYSELTGYAKWAAAWI